MFGKSQWFVNQIKYISRSPMMLTRPGTQTDAKGSWPNSARNRFANAGSTGLFSKCIFGDLSKQIINGTALPEAWDLRQVYRRR